MSRPSFLGKAYPKKSDENNYIPYLFLLKGSIRGAFFYGLPDHRVFMGGSSQANEHFYS